MDIHTIEPEACSNLTYKLSMPEDENWDGVLLKDDPVEIKPSFDIGFPNGFTCFSVKPGLPRGITLDSESGTISGTPTSSTHRTEYTVTLENKMRYFGRDIQLSETAVTMILWVQEKPRAPSRTQNGTCLYTCETLIVKATVNIQPSKNFIPG